MLWEVEIRSLHRDAERERIIAEFDLLTASTRGRQILTHSARGYILEGGITAAEAERLRAGLLVDTVVESATATPLGTTTDTTCRTVLLLPGVMDPTSQSVLEAAADLGVTLAGVHTFRRYFFSDAATPEDIVLLERKVLANDAIERVIVGPLAASHFAAAKGYTFHKIVVPLLSLDDEGLVKLSRDGQLALSLDEMHTVQAHFRSEGRDPSDIELESIAQTWSEHCSHKTLKGTIDLTETIDGKTTTRRYANLLKETIFGATVELRNRMGEDDWCVSVFEDNAGVVKFTPEFHACFKVETHNHPSAIEPYGGANTGLGGVIRDPLGTALGAKPICNTDVFCFAPPDYTPELLPPGVLHPRRIMQGVVAGVRDYGNRMGIPTVNGAVLFDERYLANPLVYCGTVGLIPVDKATKSVEPGDLIVSMGGRTGRDGIHGATFSSLELTAESEAISGGAVQIGNAIAEKKVLDVLLQARDAGLYRAVTDCGAGGFSSAVGEMGAELGAAVELAGAPLKYAGLSYTEIWISESQERMVLAVPPSDWPALQTLAAGEGVEVAVLGTFTDTGRLTLSYNGQPVGDVSMHFLHDGRPNGVRSASYSHVSPAPVRLPTIAPAEALKKILASYSVCSKEWIIRQYDHEVQGGSVIKPLVGIREDGPSDASVVAPVFGSFAGLAVACGINPRYGDLDPYAGAACAIDEAMRNVIAVGGDPKQTAILDNFCWGNVNDPAQLGSLVKAAEACRDYALAYGTPFISGKDSLNNEYRNGSQRISIPGTLLISAMAKIEDVRTCVSMDLKAPGNLLYLIGTTAEEWGGSHYLLVTGGTGGASPRPNPTDAPHIFTSLHRAIACGCVRSCHDLSEGGFAVAIAEMAFAGGFGADITTLATPGVSDSAMLFAESQTRFIVEVEPAKKAAFESATAGIACVQVGVVVKESRLRIAGTDGEWLLWTPLNELREAWQAPLRW